MQYKIPNTKDVLEITEIYKSIMIHFIGCEYYITCWGSTETIANAGAIMISEFTKHGYYSNIIKQNVFVDGGVICTLPDEQSLVRLERSRTFKLPIGLDQEQHLDYCGISFDVGPDLLKTYYLMVNHLKYPTKNGRRYCVAIEQTHNEDGQTTIKKTPQVYRYILSRYNSAD